MSWSRCFILNSDLFPTMMHYCCIWLHLHLTVLVLDSICTLLHFPFKILRPLPEISTEDSHPCAQSRLPELITLRISSFIISSNHVLLYRIKSNSSTLIMRNTWNWSIMMVWLAQNLTSNPCIFDTKIINFSYFCMPRASWWGGECLLGHKHLFAWIG